MLVELEARGATTCRPADNMKPRPEQLEGSAGNCSTARFREMSTQQVLGMESVYAWCSSTRIVRAFYVVLL